jgi:hypothetical protein
MPHPSRRLATTLVAIAATLGFVGVSAAVEGEDPSLGEPELTCPDVSEGTNDGGGAADEGVPTDDATDATDEGTDSATDGGDDCEEPISDTDGATDVGADDGTPDDGETDGDVTDDGAAPESADVDNHGAAVSAAAHECPPGPEHGPCVREVAHSDAGKKAKGGDDETTDDEVVEDEGAEVGEGEDDVAEDEGDDGSQGHGKGHGGGSKHEG